MNRLAQIGSVLHNKLSAPSGERKKPFDRGRQFRALILRFYTLSAVLRDQGRRFFYPQME